MIFRSTPIAPAAPAVEHVNKTDSAVRMTDPPSGSSCNARTSAAIVQRGTADDDAALKLVELEERRGREEIAREEGGGRGRRLRLARSAPDVLHPYTMVKDDHTDLEMGDANGCSTAISTGSSRVPVEAAKCEPEGRQIVAARHPRSRLSRLPRGDRLLRLPRLPVFTSRPQGGEGADTRSARRLSATSVPASTSPRTSRASTSDRLLADPVRAAPSARRGGLWAGRTWLLTNGATQGNHRCVWRWPRPGRRVVLQRNSHASVIDGLIAQRGLWRLGRAEYDASWEWLTAMTRAREEALAGVADGPLRLHRRPDLLRDGRRCRRLRGGCARAPMPR